LNLKTAVDFNVDAQSAALPEPEKPTGATEADVKQVADEIKSLKRPPTMMEVRTTAHKLFGKHFGSSVYDILKKDWNKHGLSVVKGDTLAQKLVVPLMEKMGQN
jgi:lipoate-protein ligase A